jgi:hypothetical protein
LVLLTFKWNFIVFGTSPDTLYLFPAEVLPVFWLVFKIRGYTRITQQSTVLRKVAFACLVVSFLISNLVSVLPARTLTMFLVLVSSISLYFCILLGKVSMKVGVEALAFCGFAHAAAQIAHANGLLPQLGQLEVGTASGLTWYYLQASHFATMGALAWAYIVASRTYGVMSRLASSVAFAICIVDIWTEGSRFYAIASAVLAMVTFFMVRGLAFTVRFAVPVAIILGGVASSLTAVASVSRLLGEGFTASDNFGEYRRGIIQGLAWDLVASHPFGIGWGGFTLFTNETLFDLVSSTHNMFAGLLLDWGWAGGITLLAWLLMTIYRLVRSFSRLSTPILLSLTLFLASGFVDTTLIYPPFFLYLAAVLALATKSLGIKNNESM